MAYEVYLGGVLLPVTPQKIQTKIKNQNKTINLINSDEINILKSAGLADFSFEVMLPQRQYPFAHYHDGFKGALYYLDYIKQLKVSQKPFNFKVLRKSPSGALLFDTDTTVGLEDYSITDNAGDGIDVTVSINLKQYREYGKKTFKVDEDSNTVILSTNRSNENAPNVSLYTVQSGDTLWNIAKMYLGDGSKYSEIAKLNNISDPNFIKAGQVISLEI